jgi:hypothetical protein
LPLGTAIIDEEVPPFHIAEVVQTLLEGWEARRGTLLGAGFQHPESGDVPPWLGLGGKRRQDDSQGEKAGGVARHESVLKTARQPRTRKAIWARV